MYKINNIEHAMIVSLRTLEGSGFRYRIYSIQTNTSFSRGIITVLLNNDKCETLLFTREDLSRFFSLLEDFIYRLDQDLKEDEPAVPEVKTEEDGK